MYLLSIYIITCSAIRTFLVNFVLERELMLAFNFDTFTPLLWQCLVFELFLITYNTSSPMRPCIERDNPIIQLGRLLMLKTVLK